MAKHIKLLGILFVLAGALSGLIGVAALALAVGAAAIGGSRADTASGVAASVATATFLAVAVMTLVWGTANAWAGVAVRRHRPPGRPAGLLLAILNLFVLPFGTALGVYGLWVLLHNEARQLFERA